MLFSHLGPLGLWTYHYLVAVNESDPSDPISQSGIDSGDKTRLLLLTAFVSICCRECKILDRATGESLQRAGTGADWVAFKGWGTSPKIEFRLAPPSPHHLKLAYLPVVS